MFLGNRSRRTAPTRFSGNKSPMYQLPFRKVSTPVSMKRMVAAKVFRFQLNSTVIIVGFMLSAALLLLLYLAHFNKVATKGYDLKRVQRSQEELMVHNEIRTMKLTEAQSLQNVIDSGRIAHMRQPRDIMYIRGDSAIASAR